MLGPRVARYLQDAWRDPAHWLSVVLYPISLVFAGVVGLRRLAYRFGLARSVRLPVHVIVVGNITVGGSGKSPVVAFLAEQLTSAGVRVGIISHGYGSAARNHPARVHDHSTAAEVGDEALMLFAQTGVPVVSAGDRVAAARLLLGDHLLDLLICDDGLQHYRLCRDTEIIVVDAQQRFGNGRLLPAGPLRESPRRLAAADLVIYKQTTANCSVDRAGDEAQFCLQPKRARAHGLTSPNLPDEQPHPPMYRLLSDFDGVAVAAISGIGYPESFFSSLRELGLRVTARAFPDHHQFSAADVQLVPDLPLFITAKDAVKIDPKWRRDMWVLETQLCPNQVAKDAINALIASATQRRHIESAAAD